MGVFLSGNLYKTFTMKQFASLLSILLVLQLSAQVNPLDPTFGNNGEVNIPELFPGFGIAVQADGKILVVDAADSLPVVNGGYIDNKYNISVCRLNADGSIDTGFGFNGYSTIDIDTILFPNTVLSYGSSSRGLSLQQDGKILVAGSCSSTAFAGRLNTDGTLDTTFGISGVAILPPTISIGLCIKELSNGNIICGGENTTGIGIVRLLPNGNIDTVFGNNGIADSTGFGFGQSYFKYLFEDGNNNIIAVGGGNNHMAGLPYIHTCKILPTGLLDNTYNNSWIVNNNNVAYLHGAALANDGSLFASGTIDFTGGSENALIYKFKPNGDIDSTFGTNGFFQNTLYSNFAGTYIESNGKLIIAGNHKTTDSLNFCLYRLNSNGSIDNSFGANGYIESNQSAIGDGPFFGTSYASTRQSDGKILITGKGTYGAHIERFGLSAVNAVDENNINEVVFYPNPVLAGGNINLSLIDKNTVIQLFDVQGKMVLQQTVNDNSIIAPAAPGMYFMRLINNKRIITQKLLVE